MEIEVSDLEKCISTLEALLEQRSDLSKLDEESRKKLMMAAGRLSRPHRMETVKLNKSYRRMKHAKMQLKDRSSRASTGIRKAREAKIYIPPPRVEGAETAQERRLEYPRNCYVCKAEFQKLHFFYDSMCEPCGDLNYRKRFQNADLTGRIALITGARVKIGYQSSLMMLRSGATVIVTTRFPQDAAIRYSREPDFAVWKDRLQVYGLDLRHPPSVELFCDHINRSYPHLDFLINNAAQTVRRPPAYYAHLLPQENKPTPLLPPALRSILHGHEECLNRMGELEAIPGGKSGGEHPWLVEWPIDGIGIKQASLLSQVPHSSEDFKNQTELFPAERLDVDLQQVDLRERNTWRLTLAEVSTAELLEIHLINAVAPFILCAKLKGLMLKSPFPERHVVNVSAMEGKFNRFTKTDKHPHTNMAKAALNMMTLTSAPDYVKDGIYMNAVDTGWVTDEDPMAVSLRKQKEHDFQPPLDIVDGAARVCDPFLSGLNGGEHLWGRFLKDYFPTSW